MSVAFVPEFAGHPRRVGHAGARAIVADEGGAVMLIGLCMACFLIGALWFVIGIGDAIVFRDTMQEVTDHAAFTSAVLHAKGMNFIAACNLMMLGMVAVHMTMGLINDALAAAAVLLAIPTNGASIQAAKAWNDAYKAYSASFKPAASGIHDSEVVAAYGYPQLGYIKSRVVGADYSGFSPQPRVLNVSAVSPSMICGGSGDSSIHGTFQQFGVAGPSAPDGNRKGLPVEVRANSDLCKKAGQDVLSTVGAGAPAGAVGGALEGRYCNAQGGSGEADPGLDSWWGKDGPLVPWKGTRNGASWQEIWAFNLRPRYHDAQEHAVAIAQGKLGVVQTAEQPPAYLAAAEFFFDCSKTWSDSTCNGDDNAGYSIRWRARLRGLNYRLVVGMTRAHADKFFQGCSEAMSVGVPPVPGDPGGMRSAIEDIVSRFGGDL